MWVKACSNEANMLVQHHPTLLDATCWPCLNTICWIMLEDVGLSLNLLKIFVQHRATLLAQQCCTVLASFEQPSSECVFYKDSLQLLSMIKFTIPVYIWLH